MVKRWFLVVAIVMAGAAFGCAQQEMRSIAQSHIDANVPSAKDFDRILKRDVTAFLATKKYKGDALKVELLRDGPTQTGIAYPKYYAWIRLTNKKSLVVEGAVRLAAIEKIEFEVTDFFTASQVKADKGQLADVFPAALIDAIKSHAKPKPPTK